jgi:hypothetical protein
VGLAHRGVVLRLFGQLGEHARVVEGALLLLEGLDRGLEALLLAQDGLRLLALVVEAGR